jgi:CO dehydrogenase nickel-insertion accessory protein CooC1
VYNQEQLNSDEYKIIGEISVEGCSCEIEKMLKEIKDKVRQKGGEAIIDLSLGDGVGGRISTDMYLISGKVIVFIKNKVLQ